MSEVAYWTAHFIIVLGCGVAAFIIVGAVVVGVVRVARKCRQRDNDQAWSRSSSAEFLKERARQR